jgi:hypothetical protein
MHNVQNRFIGATLIDVTPMYHTLLQTLEVSVQVRQAMPKRRRTFENSKGPFLHLHSRLICSSSGIDAARSLDNSLR